MIYLRDKFLYKFFGSVLKVTIIMQQCVVCVLCSFYCPAFSVHSRPTRQTAPAQTRHGKYCTFCLRTLKFLFNFQVNAE